MENFTNTSFNCLRLLVTLFSRKERIIISMLLLFSPRGKPLQWSIIKTLTGDINTYFGGVSWRWRSWENHPSPTRLLQQGASMSSEFVSYISSAATAPIAGRTDCHCWLKLGRLKQIYHFTIQLWFSSTKEWCHTVVLGPSKWALT